MTQLGCELRLSSTFSATKAVLGGRTRRVGKLVLGTLPKRYIDAGEQ